MKTQDKDKAGKSLTASFMTGAIALVFLIIGYQVAIFVHKAAVTKIASNKDHPDTVFVVDMKMAESLIGGEDHPINAKALIKGEEVVIVHKEADHSQGVNNVRSSKAVRKVETFRFNPNTVSVEDLKRLGFSEKQAMSIDHYRSKGGRFMRKSDFAKSYVVADSVFSRLESYIDIPKLDINVADSAAFETLPGIGKYFASKMVSYRRQLGGYSYKEQLMDIYHLDQEKFDTIAEFITLSSMHIRAYRLWSLPEDSLRLHPYIRSYSAHGIVLFRNNHPKSEWSINNLAKAGVLKPDLVPKISRCVIENPD